MAAPNLNIPKNDPKCPSRILVDVHQDLSAVGVIVSISLNLTFTSLLESDGTTDDWLDPHDILVVSINTEISFSPSACASSLFLSS